MSDSIEHGLIDASGVLSSKSNSGLKEPIFNPVKKSKDENISRVWTSESVALAEKAVANGDDLIESPYNKRIKDFDLRAAFLPFKMSDDEKAIFKKFKQNKLLFGNTVMHLKDAEKGWTKIKLRDYQEKLLNDYEQYRRHILMFPRQSGKTTTTIVEIVHFAIFNYDKDIVVVAQSDTVVNEILSKIKSAFSRLPFFLQPGFKKFRDDGFELDNGCRLKIGVASESVVQGFSLDFLFIDEFAYISNSQVQKFWVNIYPALVNNPQSKVIIASTPNGRNLFYELWQKAINKENNFKPSRIYWHEVPRTIPLEKFKQEVIADIGLEGWLMGFECSFDTQLKAIFSTKVQQRLREGQEKFEKDETAWHFDNYNLIGPKPIFDDKFRFLRKDITPYDFAKDWFLLGVDIGEGLEQDSSVIKIRKLEYVDGELQYKLVAVYQSNEIAVDDFAKLVMDFSYQFKKGQFQISVENNNYGGEFFNQIKNLNQYDKDYKSFDMTCIAQYRRDSKDDYELGYRLDSARKKSGVSYYKRMISKNLFDDFDSKSVDQMMNFGRNKNGTYAAQYGHDDLVMADIAIALAINSNDIYNKEYIKKALLELKILAQDFTDDEVVAHFKAIEDAKKQKRQSITLPNGTTIRNSKNQLNKTMRERINNRKRMSDEEKDFLEERGIRNVRLGQRRRN